MSTENKLVLIRHFLKLCTHAYLYKLILITELPTFPLLQEHCSPDNLIKLLSSKNLTQNKLKKKRKKNLAINHPEGWQLCGNIKV